MYERKALLDSQGSNEENKHPNEGPLTYWQNTTQKSMTSLRFSDVRESTDTAKPSSPLNSTQPFNSIDFKAGIPRPVETNMFL